MAEEREGGGIRGENVVEEGKGGGRRDGERF